MIAAQRVKLPLKLDGQVAAKLMLELTLYLKGPTLDEFEKLFDWYESVCPPPHLKKYAIAELEYWPDIASPDLTSSARQVRYSRRAYFEPERRRIQQKRAFYAAYWDGDPIQDPQGSWSFTCRAIKLRSSGLHSFARLLLPLETDPQFLLSAAVSLANTASFYSGHGGYVFAYDPWLKEGAFDLIYAQARRYWGIDIEDLNATLPLMHFGIKAVNWLTLLGKPLFGDASDRLLAVPATSHVRVIPASNGLLAVAGPSPHLGDIHKGLEPLQPYVTVAEALRPVTLEKHPDFAGAKFAENHNTMEWLRRFLEPGGWS